MEEEKTKIEVSNYGIIVEEDPPFRETIKFETSGEGVWIIQELEISGEDLPRQELFLTWQNIETFLAHKTEKSSLKGHWKVPKYPVFPKSESDPVR